MSRHAYDELVTHEDIFGVTLYCSDLHTFIRGEYTHKKGDTLAQMYELVAPVSTEPTGRHRVDDSTPNSPTAVYRVPFIDSTLMTEPSAQSRLYPGKWECPREWVDGIAVEFEYL